MAENFNNLELVQHAKAMLELPTAYMWGTLARKIDKSQIDWCKKTYPQQYTAERVAYLTTQIGKRYGCDCVGLIKSYYFGGIGSPHYRADRDYNTNAIYAAANRKGVIAALPETLGICLYMKGHVGIYVGTGKAIECTLGSYGDGVVTSSVKGRGWTHWFECPFVEYLGGVQKPTQPTEQGGAAALCKGDKVQVKAGAKTYEGGGLASFVYGLTYDVIEVVGDRVVIGTDNAVTAAVNKKDLTKR